MVDGYEKMNPVDLDYLKDHYKKDTVERVERKKAPLPSIEWVKWSWEELTIDGFKTREGKDTFIVLCRRLGYRNSIIQSVVEIPNRDIKQTIDVPDQSRAYETIETLINKDR